ncbi:IS5/IS1182 family transposase, partial [Streptomyces sp. uw30]
MALWLPTRDRSIAGATVIADGGSQGMGLLIPHRRKAGQTRLPEWKERHNAAHRRATRDRSIAGATVIADGGSQGMGLLIPHRRKAGQTRLPEWKERHNAAHRR